MKRLLSLLLVLLLLLPTLGASAEVASANDELSALLTSLASTDGDATLEAWAQNGLPARLASGSGAWYTLILSRRGIELSACAEAAERYLKENPSLPATTKQKYALALIACRSDDPVLFEIIRECGDDQGIMSEIWGLISAHSADMPLPDDLMTSLLDRQSEDGGFSLRGSADEVDVTAMAVQALALWPQKEEVKQAAKAALGCLERLKQPSGGYLSYGVENCESLSQVILARLAMGEQEEDALALLSAYRVEGGYAHTIGGERSEMATAQAALALQALTNAEEGLPFTSLYAPSSLPSAPPVQSETESNRLPTTSPITSVPSTEQVDEPSSLDLRLVASLIVLFLLAVSIVLMILTHRCSRSNLLLSAAVTLVLLVLIAVLHPRTPDDVASQTDPIAHPIGNATVSIMAEQGLISDPILIPPTSLPIEEGESVYSLLARICRSNGLLLDISGSEALAETVYVRGIGTLYEMDHGPLSGWTYTVNGQSPSLGCGSVKLKDGDEVVWCYRRTTAFGGEEQE